MDIHIYHHLLDNQANKQLADILSLLGIIQEKEVHAMTLLDDLKANVATLVADVAAERTVIDSAIALIKGLTDQMAVLSKQLADAITVGDPAAIQAASDAIAAQNQLIVDQTAALAAAVPASTPAA